VGNNVIIGEDPYDTWPSAWERLMSAADVFVHLNTGTEEVSSNSTLEAMAFGLPVIAAEWPCARTLLRLIWYGVIQVLGRDQPVPLEAPGPDR
jgi:glycosyltransferase involved in cell wall biosynthesis